MEKQVIINGDDFGLRDEVNDAIVKAHTGGVLTSASIIANMPAAEKAVKLAKDLPDLGIGVHLNLSKGKPLSEKPVIKCLVDDAGQFCLSKSKLAFLPLLSQRIRFAIETELNAQIQWIIDSGIKPVHLDSHYHIHFYPGLFSIVCRLASRFQIRAVRWVYEPKDVSDTPWPISSDHGKKNAAVYRFWAKINRFQNRDFIKSDSFAGIAHSGRIDVNFFKAVSLYSRGNIVEVMTHPATGSDGLEEQTDNVRLTELKALCDERVPRYFSEAKIKLTHYGRLAY